MGEQDYKEQNKRLLLKNAELLEQLEHMNEIIKERNFWYGVVSELWERAQRAMVRRE